MIVHRIYKNKKETQILKEGDQHRKHRDHIEVKGNKIVCTYCGDLVLGVVEGQVDIREINHLYGVRGITKSKKYKNIEEAMREIKEEIDRERIQEGKKSCVSLYKYVTRFGGNLVMLQSFWGKLRGVYIEIGNQRMGVCKSGWLEELPTEGYRKMGRQRRIHGGSCVEWNTPGVVSEENPLHYDDTILEVKYKDKWYEIEEGVDNTGRVQIKGGVKIPFNAPEGIRQRTD